MISSIGRRDQAQNIAKKICSSCFRISRRYYYNSVLGDYGCDGIVKSLIDRRPIRLCRQKPADRHRQVGHRTKSLKQVGACNFLTNNNSDAIGIATPRQKNLYKSRLFCRRDCRDEDTR